MHRDVVDKHPCEEECEKDGYCQKPLADFVFGFCDFVHGGGIWLQGSDFSEIYHENDLSINEKALRCTKRFYGLADL